MATSSSSQSQGARYFGETSPQDLKELERNAVTAKRSHMATAASYLEEAFEGQYYAWFGGWALNLRGSRRETRDIDLLVLANDVGKVRATLASYPWFVIIHCRAASSILTNVKSGPSCRFMRSLVAFKKECLWTLEKTVRLSA